MRTWVLAAAVWSSACNGDDDGGDDGPASLTVTLGGLSVTAEAEPPRLVVAGADGRPLLDGVAGGIRVGRVAEDITFVMGSFKFEEDSRDMPAVARLAGLTMDGDGLGFALVAADGTTVGSGRLTSPADGEVVVRLTAAADDQRVGFRFDCADDEHFLGFGGQSFDVDHRGQRIPIWVQEDGIGKLPSEDDDYEQVWFLQGRRHSTHTPMPMYLSSRGYAALLDTPYRSIFDMCRSDARAVDIETSSRLFELHVWEAATPAIAVEKLTGFTGRPELPPAFTFAPWLDAMLGSDNVRRVADKLRAEGVPASVIWTEDWRGGSRTGSDYVLEEDWELDRELYPDFEDVADHLHDRGFKLLVYQNSFLTASVGTYEEAVAGGYTIRDAAGEVYLFEGVKFEPTSLLDLSNPDAVAWAKGKYREAFEVGADGYMADFAEWLPHDAALASGASALEQHNLYPVAWQKLHRELLASLDDGVERLFFVRSAYLGSQPLVSLVWAGDQQTDWSEGDGFPSVIPMGIGLGLTGFPFYGSDIGGYASATTVPTSEELWYRWVTLGAFSPVMRTHHGRQMFDNWNWEMNVDSTAHFSRWASLHIRLFPYFYALAAEASERGAPLFRPLAYDYPDFEPGWSMTDQYMLGPRLLVAPVIVEGAVSRSVLLPPGEFYPLLGGGPVSGTITVDAPREEIPVFVPAGTLLVTLPDVVDTLVDVDVSVAPGVATLTSVGESRELWAWPGGRTTFREESGFTYEWDGTELDAVVTRATWNGAELPIEADGSVRLRGNGELIVNRGARLTLGGGSMERQVVVRFFGR